MRDFESDVRNGKIDDVLVLKVSTFLKCPHYPKQFTDLM